jgi:hypothetical protein
MRLSILPLIAAGLMAAALATSPVLAQHAQIPMIPDAREQANPALMGVWKVDPAASTPGSANGAAQFRTFQFTAEGKLMVTFATIQANGRQTFGHWSLQVDGSPGYEYHSGNASTPIAELRLTKADERTYNLTNSVHGKVQSTAVYALSEDGQILTLTRNPGSAREARIVYRKFEGR